MQELYFVNNQNETIDFLNCHPYVFNTIDGISAGGVEIIKTQGIRQHGYDVQYIVVNDRTITVNMHVHGKVNNKPEYAKMFELREKLHGVLTPFKGAGTLTYKNNHKEYVIDCYLTSTTYGKKYKSIALQTVDIEFKCPYPFFREKTKTEVIFGYDKSKLQFPVKLPTRMGKWGYRKVINNDGHVESPVEIWIEGGAYNPTLTNHSTGKVMKIEKFIDPDNYEKLYINTDPNNIEISIVTIDAETGEEIREDAYDYLSKTKGEKDLWTLRPGENIVTLTSDDEDNKKITVKMYYDKGYLGV